MTSNDKIRMTLRLENEEDERLAQYAKSNGMTKTSAIRSILQESLFFDRKINEAMEKTDESTADEIARLQADRIAEQMLSTKEAINIGSQLSPADKRDFSNALTMYKKENSNYLFELNKIGTNLNQLARHANKDKRIKESEELVHILSDNQKILLQTVNHLQAQQKRVAKLWRTVE